MKYLLKLINNRNEKTEEKILNKDEYKEFIKKWNSGRDKEDCVNFDMIDYSDISDFFINTEDYIKENFTMNVDEVQPYIYEVTTNKIGYETFQGAVVVDYWEKGAVTQLMNISETARKHFEDAKIEKIGISKNDKPRVVMTDFHSG